MARTKVTEVKDKLGNLVYKRGETTVEKFPPDPSLRRLNNSTA